MITTSNPVLTATMGGSASKPVQAATTAAAGEAAKDAAKPGCCGLRPAKIHGVAKYEQRKCNDLLCFLLFIVFCACRCRRCCRAGRALAARGRYSPCGPHPTDSVRLCPATSPAALQGSA